MSDDLIEALRLQGWNEAADRIEQLEVKLAKAVEALQSYTKTSVGFLAKEVLAELEGKE